MEYILRNVGSRKFQGAYLPSPLLVHFVKLRKVAFILVQLVVVEVDDVGGHSVQEVSAYCQARKRISTEAFQGSFLS
jgi:hypothetical protein